MSEEMKEMLFIEESAEINESAFEALKKMFPRSDGCYIVHIGGTPLPSSMKKEQWLKK